MPATVPVGPVAVVVVAVGAVLLALLTGRQAGYDPLLPMSWWTLAAVVAVTDWSPTTVRLPVPAGRLQPVCSVSFVPVPVVFGLFLAPTRELLTGVLVGAAVSGIARRVRRGRPWLPALATSGVRTAQTALAVLAFALSLPDRPTPVPAVLVVPTVVVAMVVFGLSGAAVRHLTRPRAGPADDGTASGSWPELATAAVVPVVLGILAALAVLSSDDGEAALPLAVSGSAALLGDRAFTALGRRQRGLEGLYRLSGELTGTLDVDDLVAGVLSRSVAMFQAGHVDLVLRTGPSAVSVPSAWSARPGQGVVGPVACGPFAVDAAPDAVPVGPARRLASAAPADRQALDRRRMDAGMIAPLVADGVAGHLLVAWAGRGRTVEDGDLRLLAMVASQTAVSLSNAGLIGRLHAEARQDGLTGLANRTRFRELLERTCTEAAESTAPFAVMLLDFDGFKAINDTLGHAAGDEVLQVLAGRFAATVASSAQVARLGGDEFAVLVPDCPDEQRAREVGRRLLAAFDEPIRVGGGRLHLSGSLGIALAPQHAGTAGEVLRAADVAMYAAKSGAGGLRVFTPDLLEVDALAVTLGGDLRDALARDEIGTVVHPLLRLPSEELHSVEVLARWTHPEHGEVPPEAFFAAAEQAGLTTLLSVRILEQALAQCRGWLDEGLAVRVAVNLAPRWLADTSLPEVVGSALARHGVPADLLCLELAERSVIADPHRVTRTLDRLRGVGVHLSVDDFGTGYSSLAYLSRLPADQLKIDKSFVSRIVDNERDLAIVRSLVDLGHHLGLEVVAEGVSSHAVRERLEQMGCPLAQGYLFASPFLAHELDAFMTDRRLPQQVYRLEAS